MSYALIVIAEIGDKSQLMCMVLAARHRAIPVALGAIASFVVLNALAVLLGASLKEFFEPQWIAVTVSILFISFGLQIFWSAGNSQQSTLARTVISAKRLFITTFMLITVAEFGDKTQLAILALGSSDLPFSIFIGATLAQITTTVIAVWAGQRFLSNLSITLVEKTSGIFFVIFGVIAAVKAYGLFIY